MKDFEEFLEESKIGIQVSNTSTAVKGLAKVGVKATAKKDEVIIDTKDKDKVVKWMLKNGWDSAEIVDTYPKLF